ncbi:MAG: 30S ribosomal protein S4 [Erysipelotrichaceae bacterium]|jgi:small subunit ribosomal protein S4|nr:30S ribosomal protein S4 [Erysipelotrichaceae bacterium]MBQ1324075.1 30S ribosomal protein S4 [Erysipelotrichaceae bacterium]MBQ1347335.1 30S ribosomal protein S4 [Erysipelotrichaceae bacterium]MBQ1379697.1 30S ribosomal protein S4 [Erysipelotrichaceae bacterium]MBQ1691877.1 30S ribosomal protein S4 [Erysipelotrichaceae bacterium]
MSRNTGPTWRLSRRLNFSVLETGEELTKRPYIPGQHGSATRRIKQSNYGLQKAEKQKMRHMYGLSEKQFYNSYLKAVKKKGVTGTNLFIMMESRLDNLVYRMGFASTRKQARQIVSHGHILVNGKKVDIPSAQVKPGSVIEVKENYRNNQFVAETLESKASFKDFVEVDKDARKGTYVRYPERKELNQEINELLIIEYYNRQS